MKRQRPKDFEELAKRTGLSAEQLRDRAETLFSGSENKTLWEVGADLGLSTSRIPTEAEIAALPEDEASLARELEEKRWAKKAEILTCIAGSMGYQNFASLDGETQAAIVLEAKEAIGRWEWETELEYPGGPPVMSELQRLLKEHFELGEAIEDVFDVGFGGDEESDEEG